MIVSYGYGKPSYGPTKTIIGDHQQLIVNSGYGILRSTSTVVPLRQLTLLMRVERDFDFKVRV